MATSTTRAKPTKRASVRKRAAKAPLSNAQLLKLAKKSRPPQKWYDEDVNPFEPKR
jgi:hypothetical protein